MASKFLNPIKKVRAAARLFFVLLFLLTGMFTQAQDVSKHYTSRVQGNSTLYYVLPREDWKSVEDNNDFEYDLTHQTKNDSVVFNFSYWHQESIKPESLKFTSGEKEITSNVTKLFIEPDGKEWKHRYSARFAFNDLRSMYDSKSTPKFIITAEDGKTITLEIKDRKWEKQANIVSKILETISLN